MRIKAIDLLTVAAAITVTSGAHAYNAPPACPDQPTLEQCQNPSFMYGTCGQPFLVDARERTQVPTEPGRRQSQRCDRVADIVLAVAKGPLAVLPRLPPDDRAQAEHHPGPLTIMGEGAHGVECPVG